MSAATVAESQISGWLLDPKDSRKMRWFDGDQWTKWYGPADGCREPKSAPHTSELVVMWGFVAFTGLGVYAAVKALRSLLS